jgi:CrcB protein
MTPITVPNSVRDRLCPPAARCALTTEGVMQSLWIYMLVFAGGGFGAAARHGVNRASLAFIGPNFPVGTLFVNVIGCCVMGLLTSWFAFRGEQSSQHLRLFMTTGILGGFTTFSAFSIDTALMWERGDILLSTFYVGSTFILSLTGVFLGMFFGRALLAS